MGNPLLKRPFSALMSTRKITLQEIADMAGVSIATVSRVINQNGRFSKETEKRVRAIIEKYDYRPNQIARSLRVKKAKLIGIIVPDVTNEFFAMMSLELQLQLLKHDYVSVICNTNESGIIAAKHLSMLKSQLVSGIIYITHDSYEENNFLNVPTVFIDRHPISSKLDNGHVFIESENLQGGYMATKHLIEKGCRRIAIVFLRGSISSHLSRYEGYERALSDAGIDHDKTLVIPVDIVSFEEGYQLTRQLFDKPNNIDGIFFTSDILAQGALRAISEYEILVPDQIKIVGFDDISASAFCSPPLTTIHQSVDQIAEMAVEKLIAMMTENKTGRFINKVPVQLIVRGST